MKNKFLLFFLYTLSLAIISEIILRISKPDALEFYRIQKSYHKLDPEYFVDLEPNVHHRVKHFLGLYDIIFSTNEFGFRATGPIDNKRPQIACIGDSVTMGFGVNDQETFCKKLDDYKTSSGLKYQAVNLGTDAYGPGAIERKLRKYVKKLNIKLLYYFPSTGDEIDERVFLERDKRTSAYQAFKIQFLLAKYSYLFLALKISQEQLMYRFIETFIWPIEKMKRTIDCRSGKKNLDECKDVYFKQDWFDLRKEFLIPKRDNPNSPPVFPEKECVSVMKEYPIPDFMFKSIDGIINLSRENNITLVMVLAPIDIETAYCSQLGKGHRYYEYLTTLQKYLREKKVDFVDLNQFTNKMKDDNGNLNARLYYISGDGHYTKRGNQWVADILLQKTSEVLK